MLQILHKGLQISLNLDVSGFTGDVEADAALDYIQGLDAGCIAGYDTDGYAQLADGAVANAIRPMGFIINDAAGYFFENKPAIGSKKIAITLGNCVIISNKIDTAITFDEGDPVYCGTTGKLGLLTSAEATGARLLGIAMSTASSAAPNLTVAVLG
jgi:hypothetical protein